ncbi:hypothetical protein LSCM1_03813 [Leishmania martiniquensis]|uniref:BILBO1 N-terminal domain-containing protein n=1 Tax=Leishmania martiniquensis TaxID=1580590 RepID=A0A836KDL8_9TRYP|nr:hypothetical protein LSCM1_03813 [Leishmania martiniquensis]
MEFPVFVASDVHGEKVNLALRYNPRTTTLDYFLRAASRCFDDVSDVMQEGLLLPFSAAYIYSDVRCQWDVLQDRAQLSPCCQVYVFRQLYKEAVAVIPDPLDSSGLLALQRGMAATAFRVTGTSSLPPHSPVHTPASTLPLRLASNHQAPSQISQPPATLRPRFGVLSLRVPCEGSAPLLRLADRKTSDKATHTNTDAGGFRYTRSIVAPMAFGPVRSHRFRLQILSPAVETRIDRREAAFPPASASASSPDLPASALQAVHSESARRYSLDAYTSRSASLPRTGEVAIPRRWYDPSRRSCRSAAPRPRGSWQCSLPSSPVLWDSGRPRPSIQADEYDPMLFSHTERRRGHGISILREERERVAAQTCMGVDELRSCVRQETQQLAQTLNGAHCTFTLRR